MLTADRPEVAPLRRPAHCVRRRAPSTARAARPIRRGARCLPGLVAALVLCGPLLGPPPASAQLPPFSYRGVYEHVFPTGARMVLYIRKNAEGWFAFIDPVTGVVDQLREFAVAPNGTFSFSSAAGLVSGTFTPTAVSGTLNSTSFSAPKVVLNSVQGSRQGGYTGWVYFNGDGSLGAIDLAMLPGGTFYAVLDTVGGYQGAIGVWSEAGAISGTMTPGNRGFTGSAELVDGGLDGTLSIAGAGAVDFRAGRENLIHRLVNISTRGFVGTGDDIMIAGFVIRNGAKRVLLRVLGPSLAAHGVGGTLSNPSLALFSGSTLIAQNDDWRTGNDVNAIIATGFQPSDSRESALLVTLEEGSYTAHVRGATGGTGVALVEVNEID